MDASHLIEEMSSGASLPLVVKMSITEKNTWAWLCLENNFFSLGFTDTEKEKKHWWKRFFHSARLQ